MPDLEPSKAIEKRLPEQRDRWVPLLGCRVDIVTVTSSRPPIWTSSNRTGAASVTLVGHCAAFKVG